MTSPRLTRNDDSYPQTLSGLRAKSQTDLRQLLIDPRHMPAQLRHSHTDLSLLDPRHMPPQLRHSSTDLSSRDPVRSSPRETHASPHVSRRQPPPSRNSYHDQDPRNPSSYRPPVRARVGSEDSGHSPEPRTLQNTPEPQRRTRLTSHRDDASSTSSTSPLLGIMRPDKSPLMHRSSRNAPHSPHPGSQHRALHARNSSDPKSPHRATSDPHSPHRAISDPKSPHPGRMSPRESRESAGKHGSPYM